MVVDEDALMCDLAETYGIFNMETLPIVQIATLAIGLKGDSRIMRKVAGQPTDSTTIFLAGILDRLSFIAWTKTKDAQKGHNRPKSILDELFEKRTDKNFEVYETGEEFLQRLHQLRKE